MADDKKAFLMYASYREQLRLLPVEDVGKLILAIFDYIEDGIEPTLQGGVAMAFSFIKSNLDRDAEKWEQVKQRRAEAGRKGGLAKAKQTQAKASKAKQTQAKASKAKQNVANQAVNVNVNDNVNVLSLSKDNDNYIQCSTVPEGTAHTEIDSGEGVTIPWDEIDFELV